MSRGNSGNIRSNSNTFNDPTMVEKIIAELKGLISRELNKRRYVRYAPAKVVTVGSGTAEVYLNGETSVSITLKHPSYMTLNVNDEVIVLFLDGSSNNAVIAFQK